MFAQVDSDGNRQVLLDEIIDYRRDKSALSISQSVVTMPNGRQRQRPTTKGWQLLLQWKDGSTNWAALKEVKEAYPVQLAQFAVANHIEKEAAFAWWVPGVLRQRSRVISKVKSKYWMQTHKYGIRIPKSVKQH